MKINSSSNHFDRAANQKETRCFLSRSYVEWLLVATLLIALGLVLISNYFSNTFNLFCSVLLPKPPTLSCDVVSCVGVYIQVITTLAVAVATINGIFISLANDKFWGISLKDFNKLRKGQGTLLCFVLETIVLLTLSAVLYVHNYIAISFLFASAEIIIAYVIAKKEILFMLKDDQHMTKILKDNIHLLLCDTDQEYHGKKVLLQTVLKTWIIHESTLKETYRTFKTTDENFNAELLSILLDLQNDILFHDVSLIENNEQRHRILDAAYKNLSDILFLDFDITAIYGENVLNKSHYVTNGCFILAKKKEYKRQIFRAIAKACSFLSYGEKTEPQRKFVILIATVIASVEVKNGDLTVLEEYHKEITHVQMSNRKDLAMLLALISAHLFYLCNDEDYADENLKKGIKNFIEGSDIANKPWLKSWNAEIQEMADNFNVDFNLMMQLFEENSRNWDIWPDGLQAKMAGGAGADVFYWFMTMLLLSDKFKAHNKYETVFDIKAEKTIRRLLRFADECFPNGEFVPNEKIRNIMHFHQMDDHMLKLFAVQEKQNHAFFNFINELRGNDVIGNCFNISDSDNKIIEENCRKMIDAAIKNECGYDECITIDTELRVIRFSMEKLEPSNDGLSKFIGDELIKSLFEDIERTVRPIQEMERGGGADGGFHFNCAIDHLNVSPLPPSLVAQKVESCKRADGQYVYQGAIMSRKSVEHCIDNSWILVEFVFRHKVDTN